MNMQCKHCGLMGDHNCTESGTVAQEGAAMQLVAAGRNMYYEGRHGAEDAEDAAARIALVRERDALRAQLAEEALAHNDTRKLAGQRFAKIVELEPKLAASEARIQGLTRAGRQALKYLRDHEGAMSNAALAVSARLRDALSQPAKGEKC